MIVGIILLLLGRYCLVLFALYVGVGFDPGLLGSYCLEHTFRMFGLLFGWLLLSDVAFIHYLVWVCWIAVLGISVRGDVR